MWDLLIDRLGSLPADTRRALLNAALCESGDLRVLAGESPAVLEPAERARLITVDEQRRRIVFHPERVRPLLIGLASAPERREAHRAVAAALSGFDQSRAAEHLAEATSGPDETVAAALEAAADAYLADGKPRAAAAALLRAGALTPAAEERGRRLARADYLDAVLIGLPSPGDPVPATIESAVAAAHRSAKFDPGAGFLRLAAALREDGGPSDGALEETLHALLGLALVAGRGDLWQIFEGFLDTYEERLPSTVRVFAGAFGGGRTSVEEAEKLLDGLRTETDPARALRSAIVLVFLDRLGAGRELIVRIARDGEADAALMAGQRGRSAWCIDAWAAGQWDEAERLVVRSERIAAEHGWGGLSLLFVQMIGGLIAAARGRTDHARLRARELERRHADDRIGLAGEFADHIRCSLALAAGDGERAYRHTEAPGRYRVHAARSALDLVESAVRAGRRDAAAEHVAALREWPATRLSARLPFVLAVSEAMAADDTELFERAVTYPGAQLWPFELARAELAYGENLRNRRAAHDARTHLRTALRWFQRLGARPWAERAAELLRATGDGRQSPAPAASLTPVELRIAELVAAGMSNKEIGTQLTLSARTVGNYLYGTFPKLGVSSRAALADALRRGGGT
ncbi:LuxR C-terminal-related transcriptional regulator [Actinoplanes sp. NPDC051513]|uniref:LuxR C-terminal-related transcriptional regulator n=1 Tax=Actinoplanes sp. NPDC051513 TaxID=3363908 RepID=UPI0037B2807D